MDPNRNMLWARAVAEELRRAGVAAACVSPGSRSAPLALALHASGLRVFPHLDERASAFFALGHARALDRPVAVLATSGTAAVNFLPAVVEATRSRVPLVVLTADRPPELRETGANQTIDQTHLYGRHARWFADLGLPEPEDAPLRALRATVCRAVAEAEGPPAGAVHLNLPFRKPLEPTAVAGDVPPDLPRRARLAYHGRGDGAPFVRAHPAAPAPAAAEVAAGARLLARARRGVVVAGPRHADDGSAEAALALARATGFPLLADALSGARFAAGAPGAALGGYDAFLAAGLDPGPPDVVVRIGAPPTSAALERWLLRHADARHVLVDESPGWSDPWHLASERVRAHPGAWCRAVATAIEAPVADEAWTQAFQDAEALAWKVADEAFAGALFEGAVAAEVAARAPPGSALWVSSSMPVRDVDRFARPRGEVVRALANRGASGIDGVVSSALGAAVASGAPATALLGDLAFLHDLPGLLALPRLRPDATLVVVDNDGGGIFDLLPVAAHDPPYTDLVRTPHGLDLADAARLVGAEHVPVADLDALRRALSGRRAGEGPRIVHVRTDAAASHARREDARVALARALGA